MTVLYRRAVSLTVAQPVSGRVTALQPNAVRITGLRVAFDVEKSLESSANKAAVRVWNLSPDLRAQLEDKPRYVELDAGYEQRVERLFRGWLRYSRTVYDGPDAITELELGDGDRSRDQPYTKSFRLGADPRAVIKDIATNMGLRVPANVTEAKQLIGGFASGASFDGPSHKQLTAILQPRGLGWSIQDGELQVLADGESVGVDALDISEDTGLIGDPEFGAPTAPGRPQVLHAQVLLYPVARPGRILRVVSRTATGTFRAIRVRHVGDTRAQPWYSEIEANILL